MQISQLLLSPGQYGDVATSSLINSGDDHVYFQPLHKASSMPKEPRSST
jgi:hypothetical protein